MNRSFVLLVFLVLLSACGVIELRNMNRVAFAKLTRLRAQADALNAQWSQLLLEEGAYTQHGRIHALARRDLGMTIPGPRDIVLLPVKPEGQ